MVSPDQLRFDFNHPRPVSRTELDDVSRVINERSMDDLPVNWEIVPMDQARQMGAIMMFGEKYGDEVRVVSIGEYCTRAVRLVPIRTIRVNWARS